MKIDYSKSTMKKVLIISGSPRKNGNSQLLCEKFAEGAREKGHSVELVRLQDLKIGYCRACDYCMNHDGVCVLHDDMKDLIERYKQADVVVLATPVYFYGISAQMKTFIDRMYPIWTDLGTKEVYYIISAGLDESIINRSLGDLDGFVEHLKSYEIKGRIYATNVMGAGEINGTAVVNEAYQIGANV
ncbi:MAG: flavodoxin family protein [Lachnospiraceae bacterium]|nr:flavodoxin family protein [Lachnospiraceae bacterium]